MSFVWVVVVVVSFYSILQVVLQRTQLRNAVRPARRVVDRFGNGDEVLLDWFWSVVHVESVSGTVQGRLRVQEEISPKTIASLLHALLVPVLCTQNSRQKNLRWRNPKRAKEPAERNRRRSSGPAPLAKSWTITPSLLWSNSAIVFIAFGVHSIVQCRGKTV